MTSYLLLENGDNLLLESGDNLLLEDHVTATSVGTAQFAARRLRRRFSHDGPRRHR